MTGVLQEPVFAVCQVPADLFHPRGIRTWRNACNVHTTGLHVHGCEDVERDQSVPCPDFDGR